MREECAEVLALSKTQLKTGGRDEVLEKWIPK